MTNEIDDKTLREIEGLLILESLKHDLSFKDRIALVYMQVATNCGQQGIEVFELEENPNINRHHKYLDDFFKGHSIRSYEAVYELYNVPEYRSRIFDIYIKTIQPAVKNAFS